MALLNIPHPFFPSDADSNPTPNPGLRRVNTGAFDLISFLFAFLSKLFSLEETLHRPQRQFRRLSFARDIREKRT